MSKQVEAVNHLPDNIYRHPDWATCTMTGQELRETMEYTDGRLLSLVEEVVDLAAGWKRAYPPEVFPEPPERPADGAKLAWIDPETGEQLSEPFAIDRASAAMGRFMAERLFTALRDAAQKKQTEDDAS